MRRFESCPHSQKCRGRFLVESPSPTKRCSRVRSSTPVPTFRSDHAPVAERIQASLFFSSGAQRQRASCAPKRYTLVRSTWIQLSQAFHAEVVQWQDEGL